MRTALLADVHGNLHALEAVVAEVRACQVDAIWMAGDWVGYGAFPEECVHLLRHLDASGIRGDMDDEVLVNGTMPERAAEEKKAALRFAADALDPVTRAWLEALPQQRSLRAQPLRALLCHGSPRDPGEHLWPDIDDARLAVIDKRRSDDGTAEVMNVIGDVEGRTCILQDDIIDTAGTITKGATALKANGATVWYQVTPRTTAEPAARTQDPQGSEGFRVALSSPRSSSLASASLGSPREVVA